MTINYSATIPDSVRIHLDRALEGYAPLDYFIRCADKLLNMAESVAECAASHCPYGPLREEMETLMHLGWSWENPVGIDDLIYALKTCIGTLMTRHCLSVVEDEEPTPLETEWLIKNNYIESEAGELFTLLDTADEVYKVANVNSHMASVLLRMFIEEEGLSFFYDHWYTCN